MLVYLAGPINGLSFEEASSWRLKATALLELHGFSTRDPMRAREALRGAHNIQDGCLGVDTVEVSSKFVIHRDFMDVEDSGIILVNFANRTQTPVGTFFELAWAYEWHKPVIVIAKPDDVLRKHPFVLETATAFVETLDDALEIIKRMR